MLAVMSLEKSMNVKRVYECYKREWERIRIWESNRCEAKWDANKRECKKKNRIKHRINHHYIINTQKYRKMKFHFGEWSSYVMCFTNTLLIKWANKHLFALSLDRHALGTRCSNVHTLSFNARLIFHLLTREL